MRVLVLIRTAVMTFTFYLHLDKVEDNKLMIKADDDTYFSIDVTADMQQGETIQVVTGYHATTMPKGFQWLYTGAQLGVKFVIGKVESYAKSKVINIVSNFVTTKTIKIVTAKFIAKTETVVFEEIAENIETGV